jgi:hypothetical protein
MMDEEQTGMLEQNIPNTPNGQSSTFTCALSGRSYQLTTPKNRLRRNQINRRALFARACDNNEEE